MCGSHSFRQDMDTAVSEIPNLIGFTPSDSLVLIGASDRDEQPPMMFAVRSDFPDEATRAPLVHYLTRFMLDQGAGIGIAVVISGEGRQQEELVDELGAAFTSEGITLHATWLAELSVGQQWFCFQNPDCTGTVYDTSDSLLAVTGAAEGFRRWESREDMVANVAARPDAEREDWARRLQDRHAEPGEASTLRDAAAPVLTALERLRAGEQLDTEQGVAALGALRNEAVRDLMFTFQEPAAEQLWTVLLRHAPDTDVDAPAVLLATITFLRGVGTLTNAALQRAAEAAYPDEPSRLVTTFSLLLQLAPADLRTLLDELTTTPVVGLP